MNFSWFFTYSFTFLASISLNEKESMKTSTLITAGITANLTCTAKGRPAPTITWQYKSTINATVSNISLGSPVIAVTSVLSIRNPSQAMENEKITCFISHTFTVAMNRMTSIRINRKFLFHSNTQFSWKSLIRVVNREGLSNIWQAKFSSAASKGLFYGVELLFYSRTSIHWHIRD